MAYDYLEMIDRFNTGQKMEKERWDIDQILATTRQLVNKYHLNWDKQEIIVD